MMEHFQKISERLKVILNPKVQFVFIDEFVFSPRRSRKRSYHLFGKNKRELITFDFADQVFPQIWRIFDRFLASFS